MRSEKRLDAIIARKKALDNAKRAAEEKQKRVDQERQAARLTTNEFWQATSEPLILGVINRLNTDLVKVNIKLHYECTHLQPPLVARTRIQISVDGKSDRRDLALETHDDGRIVLLHSMTGMQVDFPSIVLRELTEEKIENLLADFIMKVLERNS